MKLTFSPMSFLMLEFVEDERIVLVDDYYLFIDNILYGGEDLQKHDDGDAQEDMQLKNDDVDVPEESQPLQIQESKPELAHDDGTRWPGWPGENVFRMLVPVQKVGSIIGRKGESIKKIIEETKARIKILDGPPGILERAVMVSAKEEPDVSISPAMGGLLRVHKQVIGLDATASHATLGAIKGKIVTRLLVPGAQAASLIGKQGSTIKSIQEASGCIIRVLGAEHLPIFALKDDNIVEIQDANANCSIKPEHAPQQSRGPPQGFPKNADGGNGYGSNPQYLMPHRQYDNNHSDSDIPPFDKQPHHGSPMYGRDAFIGHASNAQPQSVVGKVTHHMQIPLSYANAVIGVSGANISYIRRASGAAIAVQETRDVPNEMTVEINGTASQIQTAQQLIHNFIAEAKSNLQNRQENQLVRDLMLIQLSQPVDQSVKSTLLIRLKI
ncbi:hypothetical protein GH714_026401 [Hevea brasiliensis]|uniref:K Homology domain-containing protein n=1 Tax=Hevea brasiliensis TaxID=3981 RepID=A0A6A6NJA1_HEVBR|nr:hypothetical protein GH714_026401 [Hevea brasiliensis]